MRIILFENNPSHAEHVKRLLTQILTKETEVTLNPVALPQTLSEAACPVLYLLDTRYRNFLNLARKIREHDELCHICFMSPSPGDIGFCYKRLVRPSAFLLKPIDENEFRALIEEIKAFENIKKSLSNLPQILLKTRTERRIVSVAQVLYFTSLDKKILCYTQSDGMISFYGSLGALEKKYMKYFLRCHSGFLVNCHRIESFSKSSMTLRLEGCDMPIPVSKSRCRQVENFIAGEDTEKALSDE